MGTKHRLTIDSVPAIASWLVFALTAIAFALSYDALRHVADEYGKTGWQSWLWPLLIDFALIIFSIAVLRAYLLQETAWRRWALVGLATGATVYFNYIHAGPQVNAKIVAIVPPIVLLFSFETLVGMLRSNAKRAQETAGQVEDTERVARLEEQLAYALAEAQADKDEVAEMRGQLARFEADANEARAEAARTQQELAAMHERVSVLEAQAKALADWRLLSPTSKAIWIAQHTNGDRPPAAQLAEALKVNVSTVSRAYKKVDEARK